MEWHITPIARKSYHTGEDFEKHDAIACALVKTEEGELERVDVLIKDANKVEMPGRVLCRWTQRFKPKPNDGKEEAEALKLTADNLFISLFEGEEEESLKEENSELKHFLGLMLERRRVLRVKSRTRKYTRYVHRPSKREFLVPAVDLDPQYFLENQETLSLLVDGGEDAADEGGTPAGDSESAEEKAE